ncbi:adhesion G-protein coupled receptor G2 [Tachysurus ichikawai]
MYEIPRSTDSSSDPEHIFLREASRAPDGNAPTASWFVVPSDWSTCTCEVKSIGSVLTLEDARARRRTEAAPADSYFMSNSKAVLQGCRDQWILQDKQSVPKLSQITVCMDMRLLTAGNWMAFSYTTPRSPKYDLALHGDSKAMYAWILGVQHRFPVQLTLEHWHRLCLRIDSLRNSFILNISSSQKTYERTVFAHAMQLNGKLQLGCQPWDIFPETSMATMELYMFRMWGDVREHANCEDGTIVGWDSSMWSISQAQAWVQDNALYCDNQTNPISTTTVNQTNGISTTTDNQTNPISTTTDNQTNPISTTTVNQTNDNQTNPISTTTDNQTNPISTTTNNQTNPISTTTDNQTNPIFTTTDNQTNPISTITDNQTTAIYTTRNPHMTASLATTNPIMVATLITLNTTTTDITRFISPNPTGTIASGASTTTDISTAMTPINPETSSATVLNATDPSETTVLPTTNSTVLSTLSIGIPVQFFSSSPTSPVTSPTDTSTASTLTTIDTISSTPSTIDTMSTSSANTYTAIFPSPTNRETITSTPTTLDIIHTNPAMTTVDTVTTPAPISVLPTSSNSASTAVPTTDNLQGSCSCYRYCSGSGAIYTFNLDINTGSVTENDISNIGAHIQCSNNANRLQSCMIAVLYSQPLDMCTLIEVLVVLFQSNNISYRGPLSRTAALCGSSNVSTAALLNSTYQWSAVNIGSSPQTCDLSDEQFQSLTRSLTCGQGQVQYLQLNESCQSPSRSETNTTTVPLQTTVTSSATTYTSVLSDVNQTVTEPYGPVTEANITNPNTTPDTTNSTLASVNENINVNVTFDPTNTISATVNISADTNTTPVSPSTIPTSSNDSTNPNTVNTTSPSINEDRNLNFTLDSTNTTSASFNNVTQSVTTLNTSSSYNITESNATQGVTNTPTGNVTHPSDTTLVSTTLFPITKEPNNNDPNSTTLITFTDLSIITQPDTASVSHTTITEEYTTLNLTDTTSSSYNLTESNPTLGVTVTTTEITTTNSSTIVQPNGTSSWYSMITEPNTSLNVTETTTLSLDNTTQPNTTFIFTNTTIFSETSVSFSTNFPPNITELSTTNFTTQQNFTTENSTTEPNTTAYLASNFTTSYLGQNTTSSPFNVTQVTTNTTLVSYSTNNSLTSSPLNSTASPGNHTTSTNITSTPDKDLSTTLTPDTNSTVSTDIYTTITTAGAQNTTAQAGKNTTTTIITTNTITTTKGTVTTSSLGLVNQLLNQSQDTSTLNSSQVDSVVRKLEDILLAPNISLNVGQVALSVINNLLNASAESLASSSNRLIKAVDQLALKLVIPDNSVTIALSSLALAVTKIDGTNFAGMSFSINSPTDILMKSRSKRSVGSPSGQGSITLPSSLTSGLSPEQKQQASRLQFTFFQKSSLFQSNLTNQQLVSLILGTTVANLSIRDLKDNVVFSLQNTTTITENLTCVFWDFNQNGGAGGWNSSGCFLLNSTDNEIKCSCNHLTSFAVLMDISRGGVTDKLQGTILSFITCIGCGLSAIFLAITLLTYLAFDKIRKDIPSKILIQLCFALFFLNMVFLVDSWLALYTNAVGLCISTGFFLHYFLLASFTWMGLEALHLYLSIIKVFKNFVSHYMLKFSLAGWGIPLIIVIIVISVNKTNYGLIAYGKYTDGSTDDFCWLQDDTAFYVSVVGYFCVIFLTNMVMFVVVMVQLRRIKRQNPQNNQYRKRLQDLRSIAGLTVLLGLTWGFGFFAWGVVNLPFMYLFAIFNAFQGFFIFVFHCALKENVRRQWRIYLCCGKFRLAENSDWSRLATQHTKKSSVITANTSQASYNHSSTSRNSSMSVDSLGLASNINNSPVDDSVFGSTEESNRLVRRL